MNVIVATIRIGTDDDINPTEVREIEQRIKQQVQESLLDLQEKLIAEFEKKFRTSVTW